MPMFWNQKSDQCLLQFSASLLFTCVAPVHGGSLNVHQVASNVWMAQGEPAELDEENKGNISNSSFIATGNGVVVIDTGTTETYGRQLRETIKEYTDEPVRWVINTHHHPDHTFGNSAFSGVPIMALSGTKNALNRDGDFFLKTVKERVGDTAAETVVSMPNVNVEPGVKLFSGYSLKLMKFTGHSGNDLVVYDPQSGTLFAGDILFWNRAPTTPHSPGIDIWLEELDRLSEIDVKAIIPGHGPFARDYSPLVQTREWLLWLDALMKEGVMKGYSANTLIDAEIPGQFAGMSLAKFELTRTISHFYRKYEDDWWESTNR